ncbi:testicular acid phosphatase -like protein, partial [Asbolus verrucosus]
MTWSGGWGQLTNRGKLEMYLLGLKLKELYGNFIPEYYYHKDVKILSSYADRCLMSAEILLAALFPPKGNQIWNENLLWQPIPVHYVPRSEDNLIVMKSKCKKYDEEFAQVLKSETFQSINAENQQLFQYLTKHTGQLIDNIGSVEQLYNTLEIELLHNLTLPSWTQNVSFDHMKYLAARYLEAFTETDYMKRMKGAHDLTLVNILKTLGYKPVLKPGFGASFILEMRNNSEIIVTISTGLQLID